MSATNEGSELRLVSSIRYKLANVSGDEKKLSDALRTQLTPLLERAGSQHKAVRDAAFQAFISVNNFAKPSGVILPVKALLEQYKKTTSPMVKQLDLSLVKQGVLRLDQHDRRELLPVALQGISKETSPASAAGFFNIFLRLLLDIKIPGRGTKDDTSLRDTIGLSDPSDAVYVSQWLDFDLTSGEDPVVFGLEALRLHKALLAFLSWIARNSSSSSEVDREMGPALVLILKDYILAQGWPNPNLRANQAQSQDEQRLRANAYETIGTLARGSNFDHKSKDSLLKWLFDSLVSDPSSDIVVYIESALSSMMGLFRPNTPSEYRDLEILLLEYMTLSDRQGIRTARHVAARFANNCLPYSNVKARWVDILALSGGTSDRRDVLEEGQRGLDPWWATKLRPEKELVLPDWKELTREFLDTTPRNVGEDEMAVDQTSRYTLFTNDRLRAFPITLRFIKQMLFVTALDEKKFEVDWESQLETKLQNDLGVRRALRARLVGDGDYEYLLKLLHATLDGLRDHPDIGAEEAIGRLAIPASSDDTIDDTTPTAKVIDALFGLIDTKRTEVHLATGEAIAAAIARWDSKAVQLDLDIEPLGSGESEITRALTKRPTQITAALDKLIKDCKTTKPSLLKASGIWLFCLIQYCSDLPEIQARLRECQVAFMRLLGARDELVQETASRGLSLVYERGDESLKGDLVKDLVASFTGSKTQLKVDNETELFDAGALPTGEGKSITSYKDIVSLANEVGDQSLIYKFMALATNAATWTARSAFGRFGLSNILSDAELDPKIYPKLYRYRFDPNGNVRRSMDDIWKAVVKDSTTVVDQYFDAIMNDLLKSILDGREWRVREASCAAISELIYGQPFPKYEKYYTDIWRVTLRVLDDRKESVRLSALKLCMGLSKTLVTQLTENNSSASAQAMIAQVLPFLLSDKGIENSVQEVKIMAIKTVLDVVKNGGDALKPFIPTIVTHCLGLLSTVEPEQVNYYYQRAAEADRENFDKYRSSAATQSPIFECVTNCLRFADEGVMKELAPQLIQTIKSAIGMQTKIGCSEVLSTLALRHAILLPPYYATFLKTLETQILERNHETSRAYARSAAYLLRGALPATRDRFTARLVDLYIAAEDDVRRQKVADAVLAIAKASPDAFADLEARLLPLAYLGRCDTDEYVAEAFDAVWGQHAGGSHSVKRFVDEIVEFVEKGLGTSKWALQHGAALAIASMITALCGGDTSNTMTTTTTTVDDYNDDDYDNEAQDTRQLDSKTLQRIWPVLDKALALKTFKGKERLITAFPLFIRRGRLLWTADATIAAQTKKIALREAKRNNEEYRPHALEALGKFAAARDDLDGIYEEVVGVASPHLLADEKETHSLSEPERKTAAAALRTVLTAWNRRKMRADPAAVLTDVAVVVAKAARAVSIARDTWFAGVAALLNRAASSSSSAGNPSTTAAAADSSSTALATQWFGLLVADEDSVVLESQRLARAKALLAFVKAWKKGAFGPLEMEGLMEGEVRRKVEDLKGKDRSLDVQKALSGVLGELMG
ncbi:putative proteasome component protein [Eutypa lata UCREL1]|uniref:Putative proteasome component protein n=1 Tax=Eutypa lata (strain UCR-EL1) TaxID=1287681 RepID=M7SUA5_EUTLA|nr:putative proteasome component protein [Eutypa lata UCREL1]